MAYTVNSSKRIVWVGSDPNNPYEIKRVIYCDNNGVSHDIWPCDAELSKIYLVRIKQEASYPYDAQSLKAMDECVEYHTDSNGEPTVTLLPYHEDFINNLTKHNVYAIKGDVKIFETVNGVRTKNYTLVTDCYFFSETRSTRPDGGNVPIIFDSTTKYGPRLNSSYEGINPGLDWPSYMTITVSDEPGESQWVNPQCGYYDRNTGYVQLGFLFDPNYSTPMWLKRATVTQSLILTDSESSTSPFSYSSVLKYGESIIIWPKIRRHATAIGWINNQYERYFIPELNEITLDYNQSLLTITSNNDGSYTITPTTNNLEGSDEVTFNYNNGEDLAEIQLTVGPQKQYEVWIGNAAASNRTVISNINLSIRECENYLDDNPDWSTVYSGNNYIITSSNTSAVSVSGKTLVVNLDAANQTSRITVTVEGQQARPYYFDITVGEIPNTFYQIGTGSYNNITWQESHLVSANNTVDFYPSRDDDTLAIRFATNGDMSNPRPITLNETEYEVGNRTIYASESNNMIVWTGYTYGDGYEGTFNPDVEVYDGNSNLLGTFTVTINE